MATLLSESNKQKITVTIPIELLHRLNVRVSKGQRSEFIVDAIEERLALEEQVAALDETAGHWTDEHYPNLPDGAAIDKLTSRLPLPTAPEI
ncbi:MAG: ribbon-helix-helix domain-containing protein [Caldilineaceae bacterium]